MFFAFIRIVVINVEQRKIQMKLVYNHFDLKFTLTSHIYSENLLITIKIYLTQNTERNQTQRLITCGIDELWSPITVKNIGPFLYKLLVSYWWTWCCQVVILAVRYAFSSCCWDLKIRVYARDQNVSVIESSSHNIGGSTVSFKVVHSC